MHMVNEVEPGPPVSLPEPLTPVHWRRGTRIAFRFCCLYFTLYVLSTRMLGWLLPVPETNIPSLGDLPPLRPVASWVATALFGFDSPLVLQGGSGDKPFDWALSVTLLAIAAAGTAIWSLVDRRSLAYPGLHTWFRLFLRFALGATLVFYGMLKAVPLQMPFPPLSRLVEPYGHFSLMGVLWSQVGASPAYERFTGCVELLAGILLFMPGLTLAGALVTLASATMIFVLNMTYDVPVKLFSFHMLLMSLVLLAPDARRLLNVLVLNRVAPPSSEQPLVRSRIGRRLVVAAQLGMAAWILWAGVSRGRSFAAARSSRPLLYGIWNVETMSIDGQIRSALITDYDRYRRVVVQTGSGIIFQRMDDTFATYGAKVDSDAKTIALTTSGSIGSGAPQAQAGTLAFDRPSPETLVLEGEMDGHEVRMQLRRFDTSRFRLLQSRFRWVQDYPVNR